MERLVILFILLFVIGCDDTPVATSTPTPTAILQYSTPLPTPTPFITIGGVGVGGGDVLGSSGGELIQDGGFNPNTQQDISPTIVFSTLVTYTLEHLDGTVETIVVLNSLKD